MGFFNWLNTNGDKKPEWLRHLPKEMADMLIQQIDTNPQACKTDQIPQGEGVFGLTKTNPIPVYGIPENETYLSKLQLSNGGKIRWRRVGSQEIPSISKPIDEYEIFNHKGETVAMIYISPYHFKTSQKAPQGFKIK